MKRMLIAAATCCALPLGSVAALAQDTAAARVTTSTPQAAAPVDPVRLAAARRTVDFVFPAGTYARLMDGKMSGLMDQMMDTVGKMPLRQLAALGGISQDKVSKLGDGTLKEVMAIYDPHYQERSQLTLRAMTGELVPLMTQFEPAVRDGLAQAYARRFTAQQLDELNRFFATPTGTAYAADSFAIFMDREVMSKMSEIMPAMIKEMPGMMARMKEATASLPPPRNFEDLTAAERQKLATLLGVSVDELSRDKSAGRGTAK
ncbi:DUF2059 domain-containing protein [Novosphingobium sp. G106]|uniref:DUF2059 domain-containing protein n=1 Tax=Novosphingobium sp. G106 TaxID=2849500 RepID=UPI001C2DA838|nr:DUF2059 domain-containing protein [Novosphingobium sp. G106]MBV1689176.1 DUF2059 domain-containing protein [Novosphingobium sp. G106]